MDDEGPVVAPELRERVFEQLYRDPASRATSGHGLGLALVDHIAKIHEGRAAFVDGGGVATSFAVSSMLVLPSLAALLRRVGKAREAPAA